MSTITEMTQCLNNETRERNAAFCPIIKECSRRNVCMNVNLLLIIHKGMLSHSSNTYPLDLTQGMFWKECMTSFVPLFEQ